MTLNYPKRCAEVRQNAPVERHQNRLVMARSGAEKPKHLNIWSISFSEKALISMGFGEKNMSLTLNNTLNSFIYPHF